MILYSIFFETDIKNTFTEKIITIPIIYVTIKIFSFIKNKFKNIPKCAWCKSASIKKESYKTGEYSWVYRNKDGSRDKRVKGNYQVANIMIFYKCKNCEATTEYTHGSSRKPSKNDSVIAIKAIDNGNIERTGINYIKNGITYSNSENRKGR